MSGQINIFAKIARILNRGNSIVVDERGVEEKVESVVKAAWYLGTDGNYQKRITAPWLVDPLVEVARGLRLRVYVAALGDFHYVVCIAGRGGYSGMGYCRLDESGITHDQKKAIAFIKFAATEAIMQHDATVSIFVGNKSYPISVERRDPLYA